MKPAILILTLIVLSGIFAACKRENTEAAPQSQSVVLFPDAGVSLDVGTGWKRIDANPGLPVCPPTLVGEAGMVRAMLFAPTIIDMQSATKAIRSAFDGNSDAVKDSFHQEDFTTDNGPRGQHISFVVCTRKDGIVTQTRSDQYIMQRKDRRYIAISHISTGQADSDAVQQMVRKSLKLQ